MTSILAGLGSFPVAQAVQSQAAHTARVEALSRQQQFQQFPAAKADRIDALSYGFLRLQHSEDPRDFTMFSPVQYLAPATHEPEVRILSDLECREAVYKAKAFPWRER